MTSSGDRAFFNVRVTEAHLESSNVKSLVLRRPSGAALPRWEPGAHIDVQLPSGAVRQYSLCGDPDDLRSYTIAVLREPESRGGSLWIHDELAVGDHLQIRPPRNHFVLEDAPAYTFLAGGIGITPILAMTRAVQTRSPGTWKLIYAGRNRDTMAFIDQLELSESAEFLVETEVGRPDIAGIVSGLGNGQLLYVCGPSGLIDAVQQAGEDLGKTEQIRYELFSAPVNDDIDTDTESTFEVELKRSGVTLKVPPTSSILREVRNAGIHVLSDCQDGICGSCETSVLEGDVEHRDHVLTLQEQRENTVMMICVSRCRGDRLVLDL